MDLLDKFGSIAQPLEDDSFYYKAMSIVSVEPYRVLEINSLKGSKRRLAKKRGIPLDHMVIDFVGTRVNEPGADVVFMVNFTYGPPMVDFWIASDGEKFVWIDRDSLISEMKRPLGSGAGEFAICAPSKFEQIQPPSRDSILGELQS